MQFVQLAALTQGVYQSQPVRQVFGLCLHRLAQMREGGIDLVVLQQDLAQPGVGLCMAGQELQYLREELGGRGQTTGLEMLVSLMKRMGEGGSRQLVQDDFGILATWAVLTEARSGIKASQRDQLGRTRLANSRSAASSIGPLVATTHKSRPLVRRLPALVANPAVCSACVSVFSVNPVLCAM